MARIYSDMVEITASCENVCAAMMSVDNWSVWRTDLVGVTVISGSLFGSGFTWREVRRISGKEVEFDVEVTDFIDKESLSLIVNGGREGAGSGSAFFEYRFVDYGVSTTVHLDSKLERSGLFKSLFSSSQTGAFMNLYRSDLQKLKTYLESDVV